MRDDPDDPWKPDPTQPIVMLIGTVDSEGVTSALRSSGRQYKVKRLESNPENWDTISQFFDDFRVRAALVKLSRQSYAHLADARYLAARGRLFAKLREVSHAVFVFQENLEGVGPDDMDWTPERDWYKNEWGRRRREVNDTLVAAGLNVIPFRFSSEVTVLAAAFLSDAEEGLLFRVYVPSRQMWADQTDKLLQLFRDYLSRVGHKSVRLDQHRTERGVVYELFKSPDAPPTESNLSLSTEFAHFSQLLELTVANPSEAEAYLKSRNVDPREIAALLARYGKEARRLQVDLRHERETKLLAIRHRLQSELADALPSDTEWQFIEDLTNSAVPVPSGIGSIVAPGGQPLQLTATTGGSIVFNVRPQIVEAVNSVVAQELRGDANVSPNEAKLLDLIDRLAGDRRAELASAAREVADQGVRRSARLVAMQKLKSFLFALARKAPDVGADLLVAYLEKKSGLS